MSVLSIIAFVSGTLGVWLTIKQNIFCWPMGLISVFAAAIDFYQNRLFGDMALQIFYFFAGIYGWYYWKLKSKETFKVERISKKWIPILVLVTALQFIIYYQLLLYFNGARPFLDATLTACSLTTTYMMTKKWVENWLLWVLIDTTYILMYALTHLWLYGLLYLLFAAMAFYGWIKWQKSVL